MSALYIHFAHDVSLFIGVVAFHVYPFLTSDDGMSSVYSSISY